MAAASTGRSFYENRILASRKTRMDDLFPAPPARHRCQLGFRVIKFRHAFCAVDFHWQGHDRPQENAFRRRFCDEAVLGLDGPPPCASPPLGKPTATSAQAQLPNVLRLRLGRTPTISNIQSVTSADLRAGHNMRSLFVHILGNSKLSARPVLLSAFYA